MSILSMIANTKAKFRERTVQAEREATMKEANALKDLRTERIRQEGRAKVHAAYEQEKAALVAAKEKAPKVGLAKVAEGFKKGVGKLKEERAKFRAENPDFGKPKGVFASLPDNVHTQKVSPGKKGKKQKLEQPRASGTGFGGGFGNGSDMFGKGNF